MAASADVVRWVTMRGRRVPITVPKGRRASAPERSRPSYPKVKELLLFVPTDEGVYEVSYLWRSPDDWITLYVKPPDGEPVTWDAVYGLPCSEDGWASSELVDFPQETLEALDEMCQRGEGQVWKETDLRQVVNEALEDADGDEDYVDWAIANALGIGEHSFVFNILRQRGWF